MSCFALLGGGVMRAAVELVRKLSGTMAGCALAAAAGWLLRSPVRRVPRWVPWSAAALGCALTANELSGKPVPFLRWSFLRLVMRSKHLATEWQVGDGRETATGGHVPNHPRPGGVGDAGQGGDAGEGARAGHALPPARPGDVDAAARVVDAFCRHYSYLINVGDEKGAILDEAVRRVRPRHLLELGTYCGYSALRMARVMPSEARLYSIEFNPANAEIARRILAHA